MAKKTEDPKDPGGTAVVEDEVYEVPVIDTEDEALLGQAAQEPVQGADTGEGEEREEEQARAAAKAEPDKKPKKVEVPKAEAEKAAPAAVPKAEAAPAEPTKRPLTPIERAERDKRKKYAQMWQEATEEADRLQRRLAELEAQPKATQVTVPAERLQAIRDRIKVKLKDVAEMETVAEVAASESIQEAATLVQERDAHWAKEIERVQLLNKIGTSWLGARVTHKDFDDVLQKSGILPLITERNGSYPNPYLARRIYLSADPGEEAYRLASGALETVRPNGAEEDTVEVALVPKADVVPAATPKATVKPEAEAEAERRGAREVIEKEEAIVRKPKGIAGLRSAGAVKTQWSRAELDALMRQNPRRYQDLIGRYPDLERFHLSEA